MERLDKVIKDLPPDMHQEVEDFVRFLLARRGKTRSRKLRQKLAGALPAKPSSWKNPWVLVLLVASGLIIGLLPWLFFSGSPTHPVPEFQAKTAEERPAPGAPASVSPIPGPRAMEGKAPPAAETPLGPAVLQNQLAVLFNQLREAQLKQDISQYVQAFSPGFPDLDQRCQRTLAVWDIYDYSSLDFDLDEVKMLDGGRAFAKVIWNIKTQHKQTQNIKTETFAYHVWFSRDSGRWLISNLKKVSTPG